MRITHLPAADRVAVPWKNGGGVTRELAAHPAGAGMADFLWRVSIAEVAEAGPFSVFPQVDRVLTVLYGTLGLMIEGVPIAVSQSSAPLPFAGDANVHGDPFQGPVTDLNVMVRRGRYRAEVRRVSGRIDLSAETGFIVAESRTIIADVALDRHDALRFDAGSGDPIDIGSVPVLLIELFAQ